MINRKYLLLYTLFKVTLKHSDMNSSSFSKKTLPPITNINLRQETSNSQKFDGLFEIPHTQNRLNYLFKGHIKDYKVDGFAWLKCIEQNWIFIGELHHERIDKQTYLYPKTGSKRYFNEKAQSLYEIESEDWEQLRLHPTYTFTCKLTRFKPPTKYISEQYFGQLQNDQYHGLGVLYGEGFLYRGQFSKGKMCGYGKMVTDPDRANPPTANVIYEGRWTEGQWEGFVQGEEKVGEMPRELLQWGRVVCVKRQGDGVIRRERLIKHKQPELNEELKTSGEVAADLTQLHLKFHYLQ